MSEEYEISEGKCPKCGHDKIHSRYCQVFDCLDGSIDESEEDYFLPGTVIVTCEECKGTGVEVWCPKCGANLSGQDVFDNDNF